MTGTRRRRHGRGECVAQLYVHEFYGCCRSLRTWKGRARYGSKGRPWSRCVCFALLAFGPGRSRVGRATWGIRRRWGSPLMGGSRQGVSRTATQRGSSRSLIDARSLSSTRYVSSLSHSIVSFILIFIGLSRQVGWHGIRCVSLILDVGRAVAPAELEALLVQHPEVADAAVMGVVSEEEATKLPRCVQVLSCSRT